MIKHKFKIYNQKYRNKKRGVYMTLLEAIDVRVSRRRYIDVPVDAKVTQKIEDLIAKYKKEGDVDCRLIIDNGDAFSGFRKNHGLLSGVKNYVGLIDNPAKENGREKTGYYGELLILNMTALGLGSCWVGGSFDRRSCPFELGKGDVISCTVTFGNIDEDLSKKEKLIQKIIHRKSKSISDMLITDETSIPVWLTDGMRAVERAPSAINRQPIKFSYKNGVVTAIADKIDGDDCATELGIAKAHFEIAAGGKFGFGNGAAFVKNQ